MVKIIMCCSPKRDCCFGLHLLYTDHKTSCIRILAVYHLGYRRFSGGNPFGGGACSGLAGGGFNRGPVDFFPQGPLPSFTQPWFKHKGQGEFEEAAGAVTGALIYNKVLWLAEWKAWSVCCHVRAAHQTCSVSHSWVGQGHIWQVVSQRVTCFVSTFQERCS